MILRLQKAPRALTGSKCFQLLLHLLNKMKLVSTTVWTFITWLNPWEGKLKRIMRSDWLRYPSWQDKPLEISRVGPAKKRSLFGHIINPLLTKLVRSRWLYIGLVFFLFVFLFFFLAFLLASTWTRSIKTQNRTWPRSNHLELTLGQLRKIIVNIVQT